MGTAPGRPAGRVAELGDPTLRPWPGFVLGAEAAAQHLSEHVGMDLWLVTHVEGDRQEVVAAAGRWVELVPPGTVFAWPASFCLPMVLGQGPMVAPCVQDVPAYAPVAVGAYAPVRAYLGVPLLDTDGGLFGTLCGFAGEPQPAGLEDALDVVQLIGRMLSTVLARERDAHDRSQEAAQAYAYAERDALTGLRNRRGWEAALRQEHDRALRYGSAATVLVLELDPRTGGGPDGSTADDELLARCAGVLQAAGRPGDVVARLDAREFGVLAVECDARSARALELRLRVQLRSAGIHAATGRASRRQGEDLGSAWERADRAMHLDRRGRGTGDPLPGEPLPV